MRLTRRGVAVVGVVVLGFGLAGLFGARSLNAIVVPAFVALIAAVVQVQSIDRPSVKRDPPADGFPGERRRVTLRFETDEPFSGAVTDRLPDGIEGGGTVEASVGVSPVTYEVTYVRRGEHEFGPVSLRVRDVLGLVETTVTSPARDRVLVYPRVYQLSSSVEHDLRMLYDPGWTDERDEFDSLREYVRGDPLRDVHWKSSAKRDDLIVVEFAAESEPEAVSVSAGAATGAADGMAEAAASVVLTLLDMSIPVVLTTPAGRVEAGAGERTKVLEHLARVESGALRDPEADVRIQAEPGRTRVSIGDVQADFDRLAVRPRSEDGVSAPGRGRSEDREGTPVDGDAPSEGRARTAEVRA